MSSSDASNARSARGDVLLAALVGAILTIAIGIGGALMLTTAEREALPELTETIRAGSDTVGQAVAAQIGRALDYGIPLDGLYGVDHYFANVVGGVPTIEALALVAPDSVPLTETRPGVSGISFPVMSGGAVQANIILAPAPPFFGHAVLQLRMALAATALLFGLIGALITYIVLRRSISAGREHLVTLMRGVEDGTFPARTLPTGRGVTVDALRAFDARMAPLEASVRHLEDEVATVRAIDFDGSLAAKLGPILAPVSSVQGIAETDTGATPTDRSQGRMFALWLSVVALGVYATAVPFVANFAIDRQWAYVPAPWWPSIPWIGECISAVIACVLAQRLPARVRTVAALAGLLLAGLSFVTDYWLREYDLFLESRVLAGTGLGIAIAALASRRMTGVRDAIVPVLLVLAALVIGPLLGGLLGEAVGRRMTFLIAGLALIGLALVSLTVRWNSTNATGGDRRHVLGWNGGTAAAGVIVGAIALVLVPTGPGYENYLAGGLLIAAIGVTATLMPSSLPIATGAALAGLALLFYSAVSIADPLAAAITVLGVLLAGAGAGGLIRNGRIRTDGLVVSLGIGLALGAASVSLAGTAAVPGLSICAALVVVLSLAAWLGARRSAPRTE